MTGLVVDIWESYRRMPMWVQLWVAVILVPVNLASLAFCDTHSGVWIAAMAVGAMALNGLIMLVERGFSKLMAVPHVLIWTPLVIFVAFSLNEAAGPYRAYLIVLLVVDVVSLAFDGLDSLKWWKGDRAIA